MERIRVRNLLSNMDAPVRASMKKLLPKLSVPEDPTSRYPSALLSVLPKDNSYSLLGCIAEEMLRLPADGMTIPALHTAIEKWFPEITQVQKTKVAKSKTTPPFLTQLQNTRRRIDEVVKGTLVFDTTVAYEHVEGHPDAQTETQLFEVKLTGQLKKNWLQFLQQVFAYAALEPRATEVFLVLPLQEKVWAFDLSKWPSTSRTKLRDLLETTSKNRQVVSSDTGTVPAGEQANTHDRLALQQFYNIGAHVHKEKSLVATIQGLSALTCPVQIFLSGPISSKLLIRDEELAQSAEAMSKTALRMFVHAPYIINLSADKDEKNDFGVDLLKKNLQYANIVGCKGVVVHVGKSVKKTKEQALTNMRRSLLEAMAAATPQCPILLETPAGQGTELLTTYDEFVTFVKDINDPKLRICVDTCHVFATGQQPLDYLQRITTENPALLALVHYNDSATPCGSCLDRHAAFGTGNIGLETMLQIAQHCKTHSIPMVIE